MALKPLKVANGVVAQFQPGDLVDPQFLPMVIPSTPVSFRSTFTGSATDTLLSLTPSRNYVDGVPATSHQSSAGKTLVFAGMSVAVDDAAVPTAGCIAKLRVNPTGPVTTASPQIGLVATGASIKGQTSGNFVPISFGQFTMAVSGTNSFGISATGSGAGSNVLLWGFEY